MVPRAPHRIANDQSLGKWSAVMRTGRPDREKLVARPREEHGFIADNPAYHGSIGNVVNRDALREIGSLRLRLLSGHDILPNSDPFQVPSDARCRSVRTVNIQAEMHFVASVFFVLSRAHGADARPHYRYPRSRLA